MVPLIAVPTPSRLARPIFWPSNSHLVFVFRSPLRWRVQPPWPLKQNYHRYLPAVRRDAHLLLSGFLDSSSSGVVRRCKRFDYEEGDSALEAEVLEFMRNSTKPHMFPSRKELIEGGRRDLAEAIVNRGGWMTLGWNLDVGDDEKEKGEYLNDAIEKWKSIYAGKSQVAYEEIRGVPEPGIELGTAESFSSDSDDAEPPASSSGRSVEIVAEEVAGIDGILNRLEKQRNLSFGLRVGNNGRIDSSNVEKELQNGSLSDVGNSCKPNTWRTWSYQRAGYSDRDFEAAEINYDQSRKERVLDSSFNEVIALKRDAKALNARGNNLHGDQIKSRLKHLEMELSSALHLLKSNMDDLTQKVDNERLPDDSRDFSDAWEFQENEIMNTQDKLRSLRAKLAVLEGKIALTVIDAHKTVEEKQKKIENTSKALQLLRSTCVVWSNPASEVLLAGSFDGWATQRKMEKSNTGIFSLCLRLYPGRYEIKFIVDGVWTVDPLRPVADNNGYKNNLLLVS